MHHGASDTMKRPHNHTSHASFIEQLKGVVESLKDMKPNEMHVLTVHANYGNYEIVIGPEDLEGQHRRSLEINGEIHHLFISPDEISPHPSKVEIHEKLKHTVIMQDLTIHLHDPSGDGTHAMGHDGTSQGVMPRGMINMAGEEGEELLHNIEANGELNDITYHIIQEDILGALNKQKEEETMEM